MDFFDAQFTGNLSVAEKLYNAIDMDGVVAFTGAGTSMPVMPSWTKLTTDLINEARTAGVMETSIANALLADTTDLLYAIDEVYAASGEKQTKSKVAKLFRSLQEATDCQRLLVGSEIKKFITLNYDLGLESAYSKLYSRQRTHKTRSTA